MHKYLCKYVYRCTPLDAYCLGPIVYACALDNACTRIYLCKVSSSGFYWWLYTAAVNSGHENTNFMSYSLSCPYVWGLFVLMTIINQKKTGQNSKFCVVTEKQKLRILQVGTTDLQILLLALCISRCIICILDVQLLTFNQVASQRGWCAKSGADLHGNL